MVENDISYVYKILPNTPVYQGIPVPVPSSYEIPRTQIDLDDGFIHLSTLKQLPGTLSRFFRDQTNVQILKIDYKRLSAFKIVKWEKASNGDFFPHLYATLEGEFVQSLRIVGNATKWEQTVSQLENEEWLQN